MARASTAHLLKRMEGRKAGDQEEQILNDADGQPFPTTIAQGTRWTKFTPGCREGVDLVAGERHDVGTGDARRPS